MYFTFEADVGAVLFEFWQVKVWWTLLLTMIVMFLGGIFNQFLVWVLKRQMMAGGAQQDKEQYENMEYISFACESSSSPLFCWATDTTRIMMHVHTTTMMMMATIGTVTIKPEIHAPRSISGWQRGH